MERVPGIKLLPPVLPPTVVARPRLDAILDEVLSRRLTSVVAPAGFGKSTLLAAWADHHRCAWYSLTPDDTEVEHLFRGVVAALRLRIPDLGHAVSAAAGPGMIRGPDADAEHDVRARAHAAFLALTLEDLTATDLVLVLDDLHEIATGSPSARFIEALCRQSPPRLHIVALSRTDLPFPTARLRARGQAAELAGSSMAFVPDETAAVVRGIVGPGSAGAAQRLHEATQGWPAAVRLGSEAIRERAGTARESYDVAGSGTTFSLLADEVLQLLDPQVVELVRVVAPLEAFTAELCAELGVQRPGPTLEALERRGLFLVPHGGGGGWYSLHPLLRDFAAERLAADPDESVRTQLVAADWLERSGRFGQALRYRVAADDVGTVAATLEQHGSAIIGQGGAGEIVRAAGLVDIAGRSAAVDHVEGEARHALGDWEGALVCFRRLESRDGSLPAGAAWRSGLIHYQQGNLEAAERCYERGGAGTGSGADQALVLAWSAAIHWLRGDLESCRKLAADAFDAASVLGDDRALAAGHTALAMLAALDGDRRANDAHYMQALIHAERCGDVMQLIRIRTNRGSRLLEEGEYREAIAELDAAMRTADLSGYGSWRAMALTNRGQALVELGRLDEAARDLEAALLYFRPTGAQFAAYPLAGMGDVHRLRGDRALARASYEAALELGQSTGDLQAIVPSLAGLALLHADDEPAQAVDFARRAMAAGPTLGQPRAVLVHGLVALAAGDNDTASQRAIEAADIGRRHRDRATVAGAVELGALATADPASARRGLEDAASLWRALDNPIGLARVELALARLDDGPAAVDLAVSASRRFRATGARGSAAAASAFIAERRDGPPRDLTIEVLGAFRVERGGVAVGPAEWGSRKPRDLLKVLVASRGGPVRRDLLLDQLWPDEDPQRSGRKLSVALSTLRALLDPVKAFAPDHFLAADRAAVSLVPASCVVDLERFFAAADTALSVSGSGGPEATEALALAEAAYRGDPFVEDAYEEWAQSVRDLARTTYASVIRALAEHSAAASDHDQAVRLWLRVLDGDPYDEGAHLALVESLRAERRHGEAHRMYRIYCDRMEQIAVEPAPYPATHA